MNQTSTNPQTANLNKFLITHGSRNLTEQSTVDRFGWATLDCIGLHWTVWGQRQFEIGESFFDIERAIQWRVPI